MKEVYFVYDKETGYILSGFDHCSDDHSDGYNVFNRPYKCPELHPKNEKCRLDYLYNSSKREGLDSLKYENMIVAKCNIPFQIKYDFIENPNYFKDRNAARGWLKLKEESYNKFTQA